VVYGGTALAQVQVYGKSNYVLPDNQKWTMARREWLQFSL
jgi:hypothetical protein